MLSLAHNNLIKKLIQAVSGLERLEAIQKDVERKVY